MKINDMSPTGCSVRGACQEFGALQDPQLCNNVFIVTNEVSHPLVIARCVKRSGEAMDQNGVGLWGIVELIRKFGEPPIDGVQKHVAPFHGIGCCPYVTTAVPSNHLYMRRTPVYLCLSIRVRREQCKLDNLW